MASFSDKDDEYLVELIYKNPPLYDPRLKAYKDNIVRENIWEHLAKQLNKTSDDCKKRWKCIRDSYTRIKRKNKLPTGSTTGSKWPLLERLQFLEIIPNGRKTICNIEIPDDVNSESEVSYDENDEDSTNKTLGNEIERNSEGTAVSTDTSAIEVISSEETANDETQNKNKKRSTRGVLKKRKKRTNRALQMSLLKYWKEKDVQRRAQIQVLTSQSTSIQDQEPDVDGIKSFCSHVGTMLSKLTPTLRVQAKTKVFNILAEYELMSLAAAGDF